MVGSKALIQSLAFPRLTIILSSVLQNFLAFIPPALILPVILIATGHDVNRQWLLMFPLIGLYGILCAGVSMVVARITVHVRDFGQLVPAISRILFLSSGVFFNVTTIFQKHPFVLKLYDLHPMYQVICLARGIMMGTPYPETYWKYLTIWSFASAIIGLIFFWFAEERYGRE